MLDATFEFRILAAGRQELAALAAAIGVSAADVVRLGIRRMAAEHMRKAKRATPAAPATPAAVPAAAPSIPQICGMDLPALLALRDELAVKTSPEASRKYDEGGGTASGVEVVFFIGNRARATSVCVLKKAGSRGA